MFTNNYIASSLQDSMGSSSAYTDLEGNAFTSGLHGYQTRRAIGYWLGTCQVAAFPAVSLTGNTASGGVILGTGSTPASRADYKLEAQIIEGLAVQDQGKMSFQQSDGVYVVAGNYILLNTTDADITIREIGIVSFVSTVTSASTGASSFSGRLVLMERTVLDEPVTIPAHDTRTIAYKITLNH